MNKNSDSTGDTLNTIGHELTHSMDDQRGTQRSEASSDEYANIMGSGMEDYAGFAMWNYSDGKTLADNNSHNGLNPSTDNSVAKSVFGTRVRDNEVEYKIYHVPGTNSQASNVEKSFKIGLEKFYNDNLEIIDNGRKLENNNKDRQKLANKVVEQIIKDYKANPDEPIRLTGHSHGGNVQKIVTQKLVEQGYTNIVDSVMYMGTPVRDDYTTNNKALTEKASIFNVYDTDDLVQRAGGIDTPFTKNAKFGLADRIINNNSRVKNIKVESPPVIYKDNVSEIIYLHYKNPYQDHINIDSNPVLEQIKKVINKNAL